MGHPLENAGRFRVSAVDAEASLSIANRQTKPWDLVDELVKRRIIDAPRAQSARRAAERSGLPLADTLLQRRFVSPGQIADAEAEVLGLQRADLGAHPPDRALLQRFGPDRALRTGCTPWRRIGKTTLIAVPSRATFQAALPELYAKFDRPAPAIATEAEIATAISGRCRRELARGAELRVNPEVSCRTLSLPAWKRLSAITFAAAFLILCLAPVALLWTLMGLAVLSLAATATLKLAAFVTILCTQREGESSRKSHHGLALAKLPRISILVPLYKETAIAQHLVERLQKLNYPRERLDVVLVTEIDDLTTQDTLARTRLPYWMRQVSVPPGRVKTKPRALNYALDHCRGSIVGVYDAEDAPEPNQLLIIAEHFARAEPDVACLQGRLDFYNPRQNWLSRCFTMEYAAWFRVVLPGMARLRLPIPLGGTTLFFRREALDALNGWDAHNVTEDADLGLRLARKGYRTELAPTVTYEEANCHAWPWVRQRSRWLKGYAITYATHMRNPLQLMRDLGPWGFLGVQVLFACTLAQFLLAPVLWSLWLVIFGFAHPLSGLGEPFSLNALFAFFMGTEVLGIAVVALGITLAGQKKVLAWVPTLLVYFPLGTLAAYKGFYELFSRPFFWDKTSHGISTAAPKCPGQSAVKATQLPHSSAG